MTAYTHDELMDCYQYGNVRYPPIAKNNDERIVWERRTRHLHIEYVEPIARARRK